MNEARHDLVWLTAAGWQQFAEQAFAGGANPLLPEWLDRWREKDWPLVVRRRPPGLPIDFLSLGLPLPPFADGRKRRCGADLARGCVRRSQGALSLASALQMSAARLPAAWRSALDKLAADAADLDLRVFGSVAMQALTGLPYLREGSDIDLLVRVRSADELALALSVLRSHAAYLPLDGELLFPGGAAVAWREWAALDGQPDQRVLVKQADGVCLQTVSQLRATLAAESFAC